ncbi:hypothetical protein AB0D27_22345 [Streptomyces sp. NPDC048415]
MVTDNEVRYDYQLCRLGGPEILKAAEPIPDARRPLTVLLSRQP